MAETILRFAPSPTAGFTWAMRVRALFNYLYVQHYGGKLLLRVEDTDRKRYTEASLSTILEGLGWLGIAFDGEPVYQSQNVEAHRKAAEQLLESGHAYYSYLTPKRWRPSASRPWRRSGRSGSTGSDPGTARGKGGPGAAEGGALSDSGRGDSVERPDPGRVSLGQQRDLGFRYSPGRWVSHLPPCRGGGRLRDGG